MQRRKYPEVRGKVVDYISHSIDDGVLCMNVCFKDETLFSYRSLHRGPDDFVFARRTVGARSGRASKGRPLPNFGQARDSAKEGRVRHSAASIVNQQTGNLKLAQWFLGHSERAIYGDLFPVVPISRTGTTLRRYIRQRNCCGSTRNCK
jgi:hypothetical protein